MGISVALGGSPARSGPKGVRTYGRGPRRSGSRRAIRPASLPTRPPFLANWGTGSEAHRTSSETVEAELPPGSTVHAYALRALPSLWASETVADPMGLRN